MVGLVPSPGGRFRVSIRGCVGRGRLDGSGMLLFEVSVGCLHVCVQTVAHCSCRLREVLVEEAVLRQFGKL